MVRRSRLAAWAALFAMALHALAPLAAPAPRAGPVHDICSSAPAAPQPAGDPSTSHCALCVAPAAIGGLPAILAVDSPASSQRPSRAHAVPPARPPHLAAAARAPPASA